MPKVQFDLFYVNSSALETDISNAFMNANQHKAMNMVLAGSDIMLAAILKTVVVTLSCSF